MVLLTFSQALTIVAHNGLDQRETHLGMFGLDDLMNSTLGALFGWLCNKDCLAEDTDDKGNDRLLAVMSVV